MRSLLARFAPDPYIMALLGTVAFASILPAHGEGAHVVGLVTNLAIGLLFFLYGTRLAPSAALEGLRHWRLHSVVLAATFLAFPAIALLLRLLMPSLLTPGLWTGLIFLSVLPSTVQSSIAFTSIAGGNVPAALCAASASNLIGIVITPLLAALLLTTQGHGFQAGAVGDILVQLLLPFAAGQLLRPWIGGWIASHKRMLGFVDRGSILLVVYTAFSEGVTQGIWYQLDLEQLGALVLVNVLLLAIVLTGTRLLSRALGFSRPDEITIVFCGSKKSLASGLPMASILFAGQSVGLIVLPLMLFHQIQLIACAVLAKRYAKANSPTSALTGSEAAARS
ncbi:solute carrier family 10 (sodium/bile acid cotransporter), member 7 [Bosea sp. OK403]|uniref:bile acid:sodium symporter family protein n=1 Tax=Bosea sp. OK403 TaxID=1855286 RepID=UPI0008EE2C91|nr:bile acid:sodium symporter family protein [Bosea sp. OK403]SFH95390.1 solute carrier family 10 (sodium/bile acid cotransporter), member 7 [Bosea sp. OK403]